MKKLSLLMIAILILGCGTEKPVVEEPEPATEAPPLVVMEPEPSHHPLIVKGTVKHGQINVDPELLNREGLEFEFTQDFSDYQVDRVELLEKDNSNLPWELIFTGWNAAFIFPLSEGRLFKYDTEYKLMMFLQDSDCEFVQIVIQFRTKPQRPAVGRAAPVIQERIPAVALGERFRHEPDEPLLVAADVLDFHNLIDPEPLNANGIQFEFHKPIRKYKIDLRLEGGATLGWLPRGLVERENRDERIHIMPAEGFPLLEFDTEYEVDIFVQDFHCWTNEFTIVFRTKPKP